MTRFQGAQADEVQALETPARALHRHAELLDGVVEKPHLLVRDAEVVVGVVVPFRYGLADALLECLEDGAEAVVGGSARERRTCGVVGRRSSGVSRLMVLISRAPCFAASCWLSESKPL